MKQKLSQRIYNTSNKFIQFIEKDRANPITMALLILIYIIIRICLEAALFNKISFTFNGQYFENRVQLLLYNVYHQMLGFVAVFAGGMLIMTFFSKEKIRKVINLLSCTLWVILLGPLIDYYLLGRTTPYGYFIPGESFFDAVGFGLFIQLWVISILGFFYIFIKTKSFKNAGLGFSSLWVMMCSVGAVTFLIFSCNTNSSSPSDLIAGQIIGSLFYFLVFVLFIFLIIDISNKKLLPAFFRNIRFIPLLYFVIISILGTAIAKRFLFSSSGVYIGDVHYLILVILTTIFGWQFGSMLNDVSITKKEKIHNVFARSSYTQFAFLSAIISFGFSIELGAVSMLLTLAFIVLSWAYFSKPLRLKERLFAPIAMGLLSFLVFLIGFYATNHLHAFEIGDFVLMTPHPSSYTISQTAMIVGCGVFIFSIVISILTEILSRGRYK